MKLALVSLAIPVALLATACAPTDDGYSDTVTHHHVITHHHVVTHRRVPITRPRSFTGRSFSGRRR